MRRLTAVTAAIAVLWMPGLVWGAILTGGVPNPNYQVGGTNVMRLWLKADAINTNAGSGEVRIDSGTIYVTNWVDQSTWTNDATQGTPGSQPVYIESAINGGPALYFDGIADWLAADGVAPHFEERHTTFLVLNVRWYAPTAVNADSVPFHAGHSVSNTPQWGLWAISEPDKPHLHAWINGDAFNAFAPDGQSLISNAWFSVLTQWDTGPDVASFGVDGARISLCNTAGNVGATTFDRFTIGAQRHQPVPNGDYFLNGYIAEFIVYERVLTDAEIEQVGYYLQNKYGLTGSYTTTNNWHSGSLMKGGRPNPNYVEGGERIMALWLDAGQIDTNDASQVVGGQVKKWVDLSRKGGPALQSYASMRPTYLANALNNEPGIQFDGSSDWLHADGVSSRCESNYTVFVVSEALDNGDHTLFQAAENQGAVQQRNFLPVYGAEDKMYQWINDNDSSVFASFGYAVSTGVWYNALIGWDTAVDTAKYGTNGASMTVVDDGVAGDIGNSTMQLFTLGAQRSGVDSAPSYWFDGRIAEFILYDAVLSSNQINEVGYYLQDKYGLTGSYTKTAADGTMFMIR